MDCENGSVNIFSLSLEDKLRISFETFLTGKLKANCDDTLFEKFCSFLQKDLSTIYLLNYISRENILKLILQHLPNCDDEKTYTERCEDYVAFFRLVGSLFLHEEIFQSYLEEYDDCFDLPKLLDRMFIYLNDPKNSIQSNKLLVFSLLLFLKCITSHQFGLRWFADIWFKSSTSIETKFASTFMSLLKSNCTYYIQKEMNQIVINLIDLANRSSELHSKLIPLFRKNLFEDFGLQECKITIDILKTIEDKKMFIYENSLIEMMCRLLKQLSDHSEDQLNHLIKLLSIILINVPDTELAQYTISELYSNNQCFLLLSFLTHTIEADCSVPQYNFIREQWISYVEKIFRFVKIHYCNETEIQNKDEKDQLILTTFRNQPYSIFESNCFKILNKIKIQALTDEEKQKIIKQLEPFVDIKLSNRKNQIFMIEFLENVVKLNHKRSEIVVPILNLYSKMLKKLPMFCNLILKPFRIIVQQNQLVHTDSVQNAINPILKSFIHYLTNIMEENQTTIELNDMVVESMFHLVLNYDNCEKIGPQFIESIDEIIRLEVNYLEYDNLDSSCRANIISTLYYLGSLSKWNEKIIELASNWTIQHLFETIPNNDYSFRQTLFDNLICITQHKNHLIKKSEYEKFLPLACKQCMVETDSELKFNLLKMIDKLTEIQYESCDSNLNLKRKSELDEEPKTIECQFVRSLLGVLFEPLALDDSGHLRQKICKRLFPQKELNRSTKHHTTPGLASSSTMNNNIEQQSTMGNCENQGPNILDDIITTSLLIMHNEDGDDNLVKDCY